MRLICPTCAAQYEIADDAIPPEGREVECSACGTGWRQPGMPPLRLSEAEREAEPAALRRPRTPDSALAILREEAARELAARQGEAAEGGDDAAATDGETEFSVSATIPTELPDPAALAASLNWTVEDAAPPIHETAPQLHALEAPRVTPRNGYAAGFNTAAATAALLLAAYIAAPHLSAYGQAGTSLMEARASVDRGRLALQAQAEDWTDSAIALIR